MSETWIGRHPDDGRRYDCQCARCGSSVSFEPCESCGGDVFVDHDCGEDCCPCADPVPNVVCEYCQGRGGFWVCCSTRDWCERHPRAGRENLAAGTPEWFVIGATA